MVEKSTGFGIAGFVLGLLSVLMFWFYFFGLAIAIMGLIFSILQLRAHKTKLAIAGVILSGLGILLGIFMVVAFIVVWKMIAEGVQSGQIHLVAENLSATYP